MERIGIAASRMAKGSLWIYNLVVIVICFLFSLFVFILSGLSVVLGVLIVSAFIPASKSVLSENTITLIFTCLTFLGAVIGLFSLYAIFKNVKIKRN